MREARPTWCHPWTTLTLTAPRIRNPLAGIPREQLLARVAAFALEKQLFHHIASLRKGALVAQSPDHVPTISGNEALTEGEKAALQTELHHKWRLPWRLYLTIATCSIGAAVQGWDQTGVNGATVFFPDVCHLSVSPRCGDLTLRFTGLRYWLDQHQRQPVGGPGECRAIYWERVSVCLCDGWRSPLTCPRLLGCWLSDPLNNWAGRRGMPPPFPNESAKDGTDKKRGHLSLGPFLHLACHWICILPNLATAARMPTLDGHRNGRQGIDSSHLRSGELTPRYQGCSGHVVA